MSRSEIMSIIFENKEKFSDAEYLKISNLLMTDFKQDKSENAKNCIEDFYKAYENNVSHTSYVEDHSLYDWIERYVCCMSFEDLRDVADYYGVFCLIEQYYNEYTTFDINDNVSFQEEHNACYYTNLLQYKFTNLIRDKYELNEEEEEDD
jgi:hypothetical protein